MVDQVSIPSNDESSLQRSVDRRIAWGVGVLAAVAVLAGLSAVNYEARASSGPVEGAMVVGYGIAEARH
ncbi:MAG: hypothetical protein EA405_00695 [Rhodospirillales bacterium]|nr:MAG: hypothetical protein EA405_00695 [Rhodospirillales bacterium]